jgi:Alkylmercury lyase
MTDADVRRAIYDLTIRTGSTPAAAGVMAELGMRKAEVLEAFRRLAEQRIIVLDGDSIRMAAPFSGVETPYLVRVGNKQYFANCIWDALGVSPMLKKDSTIETSCPDCNEPLALEVRGEELIGDGVVHFSVPTRKWWEDIVFT